MMTDNSPYSITLETDTTTASARFLHEQMAAYNRGFTDG